MSYEMYRCISALDYQPCTGRGRQQWCTPIDESDADREVRLVSEKNCICVSVDEKNLRLDKNSLTCFVRNDDDTCV